MMRPRQRMIRGAPAFDGVVADARAFLLAVDDQDRRIDIEQQPSGSARPFGQALKEIVVQCAQARHHARRGAQQKSSQGARVGIVGQASQILEDTVLPQQLRGLDPLEPKHHRVQQRQEHLPNAVAVVALLEAQILRDRMLEPDPGQEPMQQVNAAIVRQVLRTERDTELTGPSRHYTEPYLLSRVQCNARMLRKPPFSPSEAKLI